MPDAASPTKPPTDWTYRRILDWTQDALKKHGSESPRVEAEVLLAHAADCQRILLYTRLDEPTPDAVRTAMRGLVQRRINAEPVAYLVGRREFFSLPFEVSRQTLIPRPETETLVMAALGWLEEHPGRRQVLDVGTGSGCVAVAIARNCGDARITAIDVCEEAAAIARQNVTSNAVTDRVDVRVGDLTAPADGEAYDVLVSNPPYVRSDEIPTLQTDVRMHEPRLALDGGADGLDVVRRLVAEGAACVTAGGLLAIEVDPAQIEACRELIETSEDWTDFAAVRDANGAERVVTAVRR